MKKSFLVFYILILYSLNCTAEVGRFVSLGYAGFERNVSSEKQFKGYGVQLGAGTFFLEIFKYLHIGSEVNFAHYFAHKISPENESNIKLNTLQASMLLGTYALRLRGGAQYLNYSNSSFESEVVGTFGVTFDFVKMIYLFCRMTKVLDEKMDENDLFTLLINSDYVGKGGDHSVDAQWSVVLNYNF